MATSNTVVECNTLCGAARPGKPLWQCLLRQRRRVLRTEREARAPRQSGKPALLEGHQPRTRRTRSASRWATSSRPTNCRHPLRAARSPSGKRSRFIQNHLWVTAFDPEERYPAGEFMNHSDGSGGMADLVAQDRPIENTDIVLWHVFGLHHPPRPEDFPVQPCISSGFTLMPSRVLRRQPLHRSAAGVNKASCCANATST